MKTLANISGITLAFTLVVVASGIFGRYLFSFIPKGLSGERLTAREVENELDALRPALAEIAPTPALQAALDEDKNAASLRGKVAFATLIKEDVRSRRALRHLDRAVREAEHDAHQDKARLQSFAAVARRRMLLARRLATLTAAERVFRNWTILHKPLTFTLGGTVLLHILGHYIYGAQFAP